MIKHVVAAVVVVLVSLTVVPQRAEAARKPNVIVIVADDLGYADVGCHAQSKDVKTPHIDSIAANGVRFTSGYVSGPVCSPTRAGLLTGRYQQRFGFEWNPRGPSEEEVFGLPLDQVTLPQQLKKAGYATAMFGKWHLGHARGMLPHERGFDEFFGFAGGAHRYINNDKPQSDNNAIQRNGKPVGEKEYLTDAFTREAVSFIERHKDRPFFIYLPYNAPHSPLQAPEKYISRFAEVQDERRRTFLAMLAAVDDGVGAVLAALRRHELDEETLLVFFSDNGGPTAGNTSLNTPLRGRKGDTLEGGVRVPFMLQWPGRLPAGKVEERAVVQLDLFPTVLAVAGAQPPEGVALDGVNLLPRLTAADGKEGAIHETLYWRFGPRRAIRHGDWKLQWNGDEKPRLYDLSKDVGESNDLSAENPQVAQKLLKLYGDWDAQLMKPRWPGRLEGDGGAPPAATRPSADADADPTSKRRVGRRRPSRAP